MADDDQFDAAVAEAVAAVTAEQKLEALARLRVSVLKERRTLRVLTIVAIIVGCVGIYLSVDARDALAVSEADRAEARVSACVQWNDQQHRSIDGNKAQVRQVFTSLAAGEVLSPERQAQIDRVFADHDQVIDESFPLRNCSPAGITAYFDDDPTTDPFVEDP